MVGVASSELVILKLADKVVAFTWFDRLQNPSLEGLLARKGVAAKATSFCLHLRGVDPAATLDWLRQVAASGMTDNPLPDAAVERIADLGPYCHLLPQGGQGRARGDWFQPQVLRDAIEGLDRIRLGDQDLKPSNALAALAKI